MLSRVAGLLVVILMVWLLWAAFIDHDTPSGGLGSRTPVTSVTMVGDRGHVFKCYSAGPDKHRRCYRIK